MSGPVLLRFGGDRGWRATTDDGRRKCDRQASRRPGREFGLDVSHMPTMQELVRLRAQVQARAAADRVLLRVTSETDGEASLIGLAPGVPLPCGLPPGHVCDDVTAATTEMTRTMLPEVTTWLFVRRERDARLVAEGSGYDGRDGGRSRKRQRVRKAWTSKTDDDDDDDDDDDGDDDDDDDDSGSNGSNDGEAWRTRTRAGRNRRLLNSIRVTRARALPG